MTDIQHRHVVILGGSGFVGRHLVPHLLHRGHRVTVLTRGLEATREAALPAQASVRAGDVFDVEFLRAAFADADAVVNLVGILNERGDDGAGFERVFVELLQTVLQAMRDAGVPRLLQMSAIGAGTGSSHYLQSRGRAEREVRASRADWTLFRPSVIAGKGDGLFCRFDQLLRWTPVLPIGRAHARFQPVWVEDAVQAFGNALADPASIGQTYELVGPGRLSLSEIVQLTARARGRHRAVIALPESLGRLQAEIGEHLPGKPISRDNWRSLETSSVSDEDGLARLGITANSVISRVAEFLPDHGGVDEPT